ncbi:NADH:flavin oxidoreductase/NADH oxidase [Nakamurella multipartita]|uniref:NADH:flavin oxidoreductase/NADH oxidase n=1 Tax=Nakamurella multipartita (strain ATCC 700099 / DSM 44233 / CIP 104796 / JCM 9543 / NBRC 105858 / Y-104) TaxID=479431 RepID=C8X9X6_NAKMY|nr:NADH:flavin oxidoreductase/NADH oxidase [Nakamurella multipartita]ACV81176.1 NADH:flavin oxidoreductase/NADH oxidase [Nakamurella multipartita DSM 44233]
MTSLFDPITLRQITFRNRIWLSPMCQYSADDGMPNDWHLVHLGSRAVGGFGLVMTEATAVVPQGRISPQDTGLWNDEQAAAWRPIVEFLHAQGAAAGVQLAHAGRKASMYAPWRGEGSVPIADGGWVTQAPSAIGHGEHPAPVAMSPQEIAATVTAFAAAARRADAAGFDVIELHGAHGYLLHQFLSPVTNHRTDAYGGSFENRIRFTLEVVDAVRAAWPAAKPLVVRISATDWIEGGWTAAESADLARILRDRGVDLLDVSTGGLDPAQRITVGPGYQVPYARDVRTKAEMPTGAVGLITEPAQAQQILHEGSADVVYLARAALREPAWPLRAAHELGVAAADAPYPPQYRRGVWRG